MIPVFHWQPHGDPNNLCDHRNWREEQTPMGAGGRFTEVALQFATWVSNTYLGRITELWRATHQSVNHAPWTFHGFTFAPLTLMFVWDSYEAESGPSAGCYKTVWRLCVRESGWDPAMYVRDGQVFKIDRYPHIDYAAPGTPLTSGPPPGILAPYGRDSTARYATCPNTGD